MEGEDLWRRVAADLAAAGHGHDHADDVQDTLLSLLRTFGSIPTADTILRVRWRVLVRRRADRRRRERLPAAVDPEAVPEPLVPSPRLVELLRREGNLANMLGSKGMDLLMAIADSGTRETKALAACLRSAPAAIRRRRARVCKVLESYLKAIQKSSDGCSPLERSMD